MYKEILFSKELRQKFYNWVDVLARAVVSTLGPKWRNVIFGESSYPTVTKDWVTVAWQIQLEDKFENMWVMMAIEAAENTNREAWDGTTSTIAILRSIVWKWIKALDKWVNPVLMKRWMDIASNAIVAYIDKNKNVIKSIEEEENIATISANNDSKLWKLIAWTIREVWTNWVITVSGWMWQWVDVEYINWFKLDNWYESHMVINDRKRLTAQLETPAIIITTDNLSLQSQMIWIVQTALKAWKKNMVIIANSIEWTALAFLIANHLQEKFSCIPIKLSSFWDYQRDMIYDLAQKTWATVLWNDCPVKLDDANESHLWTCESVLSTRDYSVIIWADWNINDRIEETKALLKKEKDTFNKEKLKERLGRLTGKIANIKVMTNSETEQVEIKYRVEDAINATKSAIEDWVVIWAWTELLKVSELLKVDTKKLSQDEKVWVNIVMESIKEPFLAILLNAWIKPDKIKKEVLKRNWECYNVLTWEYVKAIKSGLIDPARCVKNEVLNSVSAASILLTSEVGISQK